MGLSLKHTNSMTQNTVDLIGGLVAALFIVITFGFSVAYELRHGGDEKDNEA